MMRGTTMEGCSSDDRKALSSRRGEALGALTEAGNAPPWGGGVMQAPLLAGKAGSWPYLLPIAKSFDHVPALRVLRRLSSAATIPFAQVPCQEERASKCEAHAGFPPSPPI
jgi:hypothetical protein